MPDFELILKYVAAPIITAVLGYFLGVAKTNQDTRLRLREKKLDNFNIYKEKFIKASRNIETSLSESAAYYERLRDLCVNLLEYIGSGNNMTSKLNINEYLSEIKSFEESGFRKAEESFRLGSEMYGLDMIDSKDLIQKSLGLISDSSILVLESSIGIRSSAKGLEGLIKDWPENEYIIRWNQFSELLRLIINHIELLESSMSIYRETLKTQKEVINTHTKK